MAVTLSEDATKEAIASIRRYCGEHLEVEIGDLQAARCWTTSSRSSRRRCTTPPLPTRRPTSPTGSRISKAPATSASSPTGRSPRPCAASDRSGPPDHAGRDSRGARAHRRHDRPHAAGAAGTGSGLPGHPAQARESATDQRLQAARRRQRGGHAARRRAQPRRVDDQRGNAGQGVAYAARKAGVPCTVVAIETAPASQARADEGARRELVPVSYDGRVEGARGAGVSRSGRHLRAPVRRSQLHRRPRDDGAGDPRRRAGHGRGDRRHRRRRAHRRRRQRHQGAQARHQVWGAEPETAAPAALSFAMGSPAGVQGLEAVVCGRRRRAERVPADVGTDAAVVDGCIVVTLDETGAPCG